MNSKTCTDRLIGGLGGGGGALLLSVLFEYLLFPSMVENSYYWMVILPLGVIGALMIAVAVFLDLKSRNKTSAP